MDDERFLGGRGGGFIVETWRNAEPPLLPLIEKEKKRREKRRYR